jgi:hypothetical protein
VDVYPFGANSVLTISAGTETAGTLNVDQTASGGYSILVNQTGGNLTVTGVETIGGSYTAGYVQSGGTNAVGVGGGLYLGNNSGSTGSYSLSGGSLTVAGAEYIGNKGSGAFTQSGGVNAVSGQLTLGQNSGGSGVYTLNGGTLTTAGIVYGAGNNSFEWTAGTVNFTTELAVTAGGYLGNNLIIGANQNVSVLDLLVKSDGALTQTGGTVAAQTNPKGYLSENIEGNGAYNQSGGTNTVSGSLGVGQSGVAGNSSYNLSESGSLTVTGNEIIGYQATGAFNQTGGANTVGELAVGVYGAGSGSYSLSGGNLNAVNEIVGYGKGGVGAMIQTGGVNTVTQDLSLGVNPTGGTGTYRLNGGTLTTAGIVYGAGNDSFDWTSGTVNFTTDLAVTAGGYLGNNLTIGAGQNLTAADLLVNSDGVFNQTGGAVTASNNATLDGVYNLNGGSLSVGGQLDNSGVLNLAGGALTGAGQLNNNAALSGYGTIAGTGGFLNNALVTQAGGNLQLSNSGANANYGNWNLAAGLQLQLGSGVSLTNAGSLLLNSGVVTGGGTLENTYGGNISGPGLISAIFKNDGGVLSVNSGTTTISQGFTNNGVVQLGAITANLTGGALVNNGDIQGYGNLGNALSNQGGIEALGGTLYLGGKVSNTATGLIAVSTGNKILVTQGLASNQGVINLTGGTFDNNNKALVNKGEISGYGSIRTGGAGLDNQAILSLSGGTTTVNGNLTNEAGAQVQVSYNAAIFTGNVVNNGTFITTNATVTFAGGFVENGAFISDPSTFNYTDLTIGAGGYLSTAAGDIYNVSGNLSNNSTQNTLWDTAAAMLVFNGAGTQNFTLAGKDEGNNAGGFSNNFAWGEVKVNNGVTLDLLAGGGGNASALYASVFLLQGGLSQLSQINSSYNIYYDATQAANAYLLDKNYSLTGGGQLIADNMAAPVPLPGGIWLFGSALAGLLGGGRRKPLSVG